MTLVSIMWRIDLIVAACLTVGAVFLKYASTTGTSSNHAIHIVERQTDKVQYHVTHAYCDEIDLWLIRRVGCILSHMCVVPGS